MATRLFNVALAASATAAAMGAAYATRGTLAAASVASWFALHVTIAKMYESACGSRTIADYPGWSWLASLWHGLLAMPILVSATVLLLPTTAGVDGFLREGWERMPWPLEHVHYAIFGYMLKACPLPRRHRDRLPRPPPHHHRRLHSLPPPPCRRRAHHSQRRAGLPLGPAPALPTHRRGDTLAAGARFRSWLHAAALPAARRR